MVVALGPGKFYGSSLPRPRFYNNVNSNSEHVDPPVSVMDPLLSWAREAHWSMGGLNTERVRFQGRIEGNVDKLRKFREKQTKLQARNTPEKQKDQVRKGDKKRADSVSPPPAPRVTKKRKFVDLFDEDGEAEEEEQKGRKKMPVRKLVGEFEKVAKEDSVMKIVDELSKEGSEGKKKPKKRLRKAAEDNSKSDSSPVRSSPRFMKEDSVEI
ncbi:hypothetical protein LINPERPRIM_LOCUS3386 [Linum perenne]